MSIVEAYVSFRVRYDQLTRRLADFFWGYKFSVFKLSIHVMFILIGAVWFSVKAKEIGSNLELYAFGVVALLDLVGMYWAWRKKWDT